MTDREQTPGARSQWSLASPKDRRRLAASILLVMVVTVGIAASVIRWPATFRHSEIAAISIVSYVQLALLYSAAAMGPFIAWGLTRKKLWLLLAFLFPMPFIVFTFIAN
jgi:hypothetical protein